MWRLYHYTLCPYSRKARIALGEKRVTFELVHEKPWERREAFLALNPAGLVPVLYETDSRQVLADSTAIVEYLDETVAAEPLIGAAAAARAETRRLVAWFDIKFYQEVTALLYEERVWKRFIAKAAVTPAVVRAALYNVRGHLDYIGYLCDRRRWLAGDHFSAADIAAAAQMSVVDYLGGIDWDSAGGARDWYVRVKSRPSFRPLLADRLTGVTPPPAYEKLDF
ncbi:MAG: glutathione S-transferase family protein [Alphaproteobacteria bacterium]|nr:MAG: glutathione S-transferase family protein [Alphaproteobacteria bacterium]